MNDDEMTRYLRGGFQMHGSTYEAIADRIEALLAEVATLRAVECPRGWTRDEVLHELDTHPGAKCEFLSPFDDEWVPYARRTMGSWHPEVRRYDVRVVLPEPPVTVWVPLTKLVGRTLPGETEPVDRIEWVTSAAAHDCRARWRWHPKSNLSWLDFPDGTLNLETGMVEVLAEGDA